MHDFTELDRSLNLNRSEKYHLSIQLAPDGFSFCILETYIGRYVGMKHFHFKENLHFDNYLEKVNEVIHSDSLLKHSYGSVSLMWVTSKATLIPEELFKAEEVKSIFSVNQHLGEFDEIHYVYNPVFKLYTAFSIHHELLNIFRQKFEDVRVFNQWSSLLALPNMEEAVEGVKVFVNFNYGFFDLVIVKEKRLQLCNSFHYKNENDFVFYLLNAIKQLAIDIQQCDIVFLGSTSDKGRYFDLLGRFVNDFEISDEGETFSFSPHLKNISKPTFYNLYNLYKCALLAESTEG